MWQAQGKIKMHAGFMHIGFGEGAKTRHTFETLGAGGRIIFVWT
jgi:hypothetical protein